MLEKENRQLKAQINRGLPDAAAQHGVPSFRTGNGDMSFVEVEAREDDEDDKDADPTIECQTVCKFVRPNAGAAVGWVRVLCSVHPLRVPSTLTHVCYTRKRRISVRLPNSFKRKRKWRPNIALQTLPPQQKRRHEWMICASTYHIDSFYATFIRHIYE